MIQAEHITKTFNGFMALDDMSLHVPKGTIYGLVGPNGAGKSTLIRHLTGIYRPDSGSILIDGLPVYDNPEAKAKFTYIPDDMFYFLQSNTLEMKQFYQGIYKKFDAALFDRLQEFFPNIDTKRSIRRLSKGMQKQVAFWLSICAMPELMILDEPMDGLDPVMRRQIWSIILSKASESRTIHILYAFYDAVEAYVLLLQGITTHDFDGVVLQVTATHSETYRHFFGSTPVLP